MLPATKPHVEYSQAEWFVHDSGINLNFKDIGDIFRVCYVQKCIKSLIQVDLMGIQRGINLIFETFLHNLTKKHLKNV